MKLRVGMRFFWVALMLASLLSLALVSTAVSAATVGLLTIVDGETTLLRDTGRYAAEEGLQLRADDIVRTGAGARLARIEFDDGRTLDLGPATQVLLSPRGLAAADRPAAAYLAQGWAKLSAAPKGGTAPGLASPRLDALRVSGNVVMRAEKDGDWLFVETGAAEAVQRRDGRMLGSQALREGDSFALRGTELGSVSRRLPAELVAKMPRVFADPLPHRAARFANTSVEPTSAGDVVYEDVAAWLNAEAALRLAFVHRLSPLATRGTRFRTALLTEMTLHPEWQSLLAPPAMAPEKPRAKPPVAVASRASAPAATVAHRVADGSWIERREPIEPELAAPAERVAVMPVVVMPPAEGEAAATDTPPADVAR